MQTSPGADAVSAIEQDGGAPGLAAVLEEIASSEPLIAHPAGAEQGDLGYRSHDPWENESALDATIMHGLVRP
jgi:hypothetical protein